MDGWLASLGRGCWPSGPVGLKATPSTSRPPHTDNKERRKKTRLRVALGAQRAGLEHGQLVEEAALVHIQARVHVVQGGAHACVTDLCMCVWVWLWGCWVGEWVNTNLCVVMGGGLLL